MIGKTSQAVEVERQREAEMFKLFEFLTSYVSVNKLTSTEDYRNDTASESTANC